MEHFAQLSLFESKFDHLIPYENESKSFRRSARQDLKFAIDFGALHDLTFCILFLVFLNKSNLSAKSDKAR